MIEAYKNSHDFKRRIETATIITRFSVLFSFGWMVLLYWLSLPLLFTIASLAFTGSVVSILFLRYRKYDVARSVVLVCVMIAIFIGDSVAGFESKVSEMLAITAIVPFVSFSYDHERRYVLFFTLSSILLWLTTVATDHQLFPHEISSEIARTYISWMSEFSVLAIIALLIFHFDRKVMAYESSLTDALGEVDRASKAKDDFFASMSHELRTPLTSIIGNSEYLLSQDSDSEHESVLKTIEAAGKSQLALVNDILDMSKIESGRFSIDEFAYDLSELLEGVKNMISVRARDAGLRLVVNQESQEAFKLLGDSNRIAQILTNLLTNAIKFTDNGAVTLTCSKVDNKLIFKVKDSGIGMTPETLERVFKRFEQADGSISRRFGGSGLGLFISLNLAEMMGGTIDASSKEGVGSTFQLTIPYKPSDIPVSQNGEKDRVPLMDQESITGYVLIAEDTPELQLLERRILEGFGLTVEVANDGVEAVAMAEQNSYDLILMDMQMPNMDGIEATKVLRERKITTPVVALTANVMQKHKDSFRQAGCDGFLAKPINRQEFRKTLSRFLTRDVP